MLIGFPEGTQYGYQKGVRGRVGLFQCECGCGQTFFATWVTRVPAYANKTHRMRAYRARARERASNFNKLSHEILGAIREAKLAISEGVREANEAEWRESLRESPTR